MSFAIAIDLLFGLGVTSYLIYIIPNSNLQEIVLTIIASVFGGIFTLVGVAWTIKQSQKDNYEKEVQKQTPYLYNDISSSNHPIKINFGGSYNLGIRIISDNLFIFKGCIFDGEHMECNKVIPPQENFLISFDIEKYDDISILGTDIYNNLYRYDLEFKNNEKSKSVNSIGLPIFIDD